MKINIFSEDNIDTLSARQNLPIIEEYIRQNETNEWLYEVFHGDNPLKPSKINIIEFEMDMSSLEPDNTDLENAKRLYEALKDLPESTACDPRLWMGLTFGQFYSYMRYRYNANEKISYVRNKWLFQGHSKRISLFRQGISMLWWYAYLTYDDTKADPYELTEFCFKHKDILISIYSRTFSGSKNVRLGLLEALRDFERDGGNLEKRELYNGAIKYVSFLGGAYLIDLFSKEEIYDKVYDELVRLDCELKKNDKNLFTLSD